MDERDALRELLDARAIEQLMVRYIDRIDANGPVGSAACFAPDGVGVYWGEYRGRAAIAERLAGEWLFARREVVGVGGLVAGDRNKDREFPGHPGRLVR